MSHFKARIAEHIVDYETVHIRPFAIFRRFFVPDGEPDLKVKTTQEDIDKDKKEYIRLFQLVQEPWDGLIETYSVLRKTAEAILDIDAFLIHGVAIMANGKGYIFTGNSGVGKSTHAFLWKKNLRDVCIINGDKPFILTGESPAVCSSPWGGKEKIYTNVNAPLQAVIYLERAEDNKIEKITFSEAFPYIYQQVHRPNDIGKLRKTLSLLKSLDGKIDFYHFNINNFKDDCFQVAYDALINGKSHEC